MTGIDDGTFRAPTRFETGRSADEVLVADINDDNRPDILVASRFENTVLPLLNDGTGSFPFRLRADVDMFRLTFTAGEEISLTAIAQNLENPSSLNSYLRVFDSAGNQIAANDSFADNDAHITLTIPQTAVYYVGVSGSGNSGYDPTAPDSGFLASSGEFLLRIERRSTTSSTIKSITATAASGIPARTTVASANPGQAITITGTGFRDNAFFNQDRVVFTTLNTSGSLGITTATPQSVSSDGTQIVVVVPDNAVSGTVRLEREQFGRFLQIVPTIDNVEVGTDGTFHDAFGTISGSGFAEGAQTVNFGNTPLVDLGLFSGPDVFSFSLQDLSVRVPFNVPHGPITVTTVGGTSAPLDRQLNTIVATADSGTPLSSSIASANPGQAITLQGTGLTLETDVIFTSTDTSGNQRERIAAPFAVNADGTQVTVLVPDDAVTASIAIVGDKNGTQVPLQVVPLVTAVDFTSVNSSARTGRVRVTGRGFVEGADTQYQIGSVQLVDFQSGSGPDVFSTNTIADMTVPLDDNPFGAVTVTTAGGSSSPFVVDFTGITSTALSGTAADANKPSANAGQVITLNGSGLSTSTDLVVQFYDDSGNLQTRLLNPTFAAADGSSVELQLSTDLNGAFTVNVAGSATAPLLQIVPTINSFDINTTANVRLTGSGFVEGRDSQYNFAGGSRIDVDLSTTTVNVFSSGTGVDVNLPTHGLGTLSVTTSAGTSAPVDFNVAHPGLGRLNAVAQGSLIVSNVDGYQFINENTGQVTASFDLPGANSNNTGLQVLSDPIPSLNGTMIPAGNLLIFNGGNNPDTVYAVDPADGAILASLPLLNFDLVGGTFDAASGSLFIIEGSPNEIIEIDPADGMRLSTTPAPFDISAGGLTLDPVTGDLWVISSQALEAVRISAGTGGSLNDTPSGGESLPPWVDGRLGNGLKLEASSTGIVPGSVISGMTDGTFEFSYRTSRPVNQGIFSAASATNADEFVVFFTSDGRFRATFDAITLDWDVDNFANGEFHHYALVRDQANSEVTLYVDGASLGTKQADLTQIDTGEIAAVIGQEQDGLLGGNFDPNQSAFGVIDELRIWSVARSAAEVAANSSAELTGAESGLSGYWKFNETSGATFNDSTANSRHGTLRGIVLERVPLQFEGAGLGFDATGIDFDSNGDFLVSSTQGVVYRFDRHQDLSQPTDVKLTSISTAAAAGTPTNGSLASANAGQTITLVGTNLAASGLQVIVPTIDSSGNQSEVPITPIAVSADGTQAQVILPGLATTGEITVRVTSPRDLGFAGGTSRQDAIYRDVEIPFTTSATTAEITFADLGLQSVGDESWGIDNVRVARSAAPDTPVFSDDFEDGANSEWAVQQTELGALSVFSQFSGRFNGEQTLSLSGLTGSTDYVLIFDLYIIDSWDGNIQNSVGPDIFEVRVDGQTLFSEAFVAFTSNIQTYDHSDAGSIPLQIVPTITGLQGNERPGLNSGFDIFGSGFVEGGTTLTVGGLTFIDEFTNQNDFNTSGSSNNQLFMATPLSLDGPIQISTAGGSFDFSGPQFAEPDFLLFSGIESTADSGTPVDGNVASANTEQQITLTGVGFTSSTVVQFPARDDAGTAGVLSRTGFTTDNGARLVVSVPALAVTGSIRVVGSNTTVPLQIVPRLSSLGGEVTAGQQVLLDGTGLSDAGLSVTIGGQSATAFELTTIRSDQGGSFGRDQQILTVTVPAGTTGFEVTVSTPGGSFVLSEASVAIESSPLIVLPDVVTTEDIGDTLSTSLLVTLPSNRTVTVDPVIGDNTSGTGDVDLFRFELTAGDQIEIDVQGSGAGVPGGLFDSFLRLFDSDGNLITSNDFGGFSSDARIVRAITESGTYYAGVSGDFNRSYDPNTADSGSGGNTGNYRLLVSRVDADRTATGVTPSASSGTPRLTNVASANPGDRLTIFGSGLTSLTGVVFTATDSSGNLSERFVFPSFVSADGTLLDVVVPTDAVSGTVRLETESDGVFLLIVPTITDVDQGAFDRFLGGSLSIFGGGFTEGNTDVSLGGVTLTDVGPFEGVNVGFGNDDLSLTVPETAATGPISVTTFGGTSAPFGLTLDTITATAASGTAADSSQASANPGQTITLAGTGFDASTDVVFRISDSNGTEFERVVRPDTVNAGGTELTITVPTDAITSDIQIVGDQNAASIPLQIVPVVSDIDFRFVSGNSIFVRLTGNGFIENHDTLFQLGDVQLIDRNSSNGPDVFSSNTIVDFQVLAADNPYGAAIVTTAGGTSAPFTLPVTGITAVAASGTPANSEFPSANAGQTITITGTDLATSLDVIGQYYNDSGTVATRLLNPSAVASDGTSADLAIPADFNGAFELGIAGFADSPVLQIVPTISGFDVTTSNGRVRMTGSGFVEGNGAVYTFGGTDLVDTSRNVDPNVFSNGDTVDLNLPRHGFGTFSVTTEAGTSAPMTLDVASPAVGELNGIAGGGTLLANRLNFRVFDPVTGLISATFAQAGGDTNRAGFDVLSEAVTINGTSVPAGTLLLIDGNESFDKVFAVDPSDGTLLVTLDLGQNIDPTAGAYDSTTGNLFILDGSPDRVLEISLADGSVLSEFASPIGLDSTHGGLAFDPDTDNLWIGSDDSSTIVELERDGTEVRRVDLAAQSVSNEITGFDFDAAGNLLVSSHRGVVYRVDVDAQSLLAASAGESPDGEAPDAETLLAFLSFARESFVIAGAPDATIPGLDDVEIQVANLPDRTLGLATGNRILIDADAAGNGWYIDKTPQDDSEFISEESRPNGIDLLTVVRHEFGHLLGLDDLIANEIAQDLMREELESGVRPPLSSSDLDELFEDFPALADLLHNN